MRPTVKLPMETEAARLLQYQQVIPLYKMMRIFFQTAAQREQELYQNDMTPGEFREYLLCVQKGRGNMDFAKYGQWLSLNSNVLANVTKIANGTMDMMSIPTNDWIELANYDALTRKEGRIQPVADFVSTYRDEIVAEALSKARRDRNGNGDDEKVLQAIINYTPPAKTASR